jgi:membrane protein implicated in regulation of membrane protease activity
MDWIPWLFGAITLVGVLYFIVSLFVGDTDLDIGGLHLDVGFVGSEDGEFGCMLIAAVMAGFGAVGLLGWFSRWDTLTTLVIAAVFGLVFGRGVVSLLRFVVRQQSDSITDENLIGMMARVTIEVPADKTGEAMVQGAFVAKYPIRAVDGQPLHKGEMVQIVEVRDGLLFVQRHNA